jgi:hypothetical protein
MKPCILYIVALVLVLAAGGSAGAEKGENTRFAEYVAGVELILGEKNLSSAAQARRYRSLCIITGVNRENAKAFIERFRNDPAGWQKFEALVLELLQKKG